MTVVDRFRTAISAFNVQGRLGGVFLIVDDEQDCYSVLSAYIRHEFPDSQVIYVQTVADAFNVISSIGADHIRCAIIDWHLPMGFGSQIIERILHDDPMCPVFAYTADEGALESIRKKYPKVHRVLKPGWDYIYASLSGRDRPEGVAYEHTVAKRKVNLG